MRLLLVATALIASSGWASGTEDEMWEKAKREAAAFQKRTGVAMEWLEGDPSQVQQLSREIRAWAPIALDLDASLPALIAELSIYPDGFFRAAGFKRVVLTRGLERDGKAWGGFAFWGGKFQGTLFVGLRSVRHAAVTIHHEVFHLAQQLPSVRAREGEWRACNPGGFRYYGEGPVDRSAPRVATITDYARTNLIEDQAEVFAWLVADAAFVDRQAEQDEGIACKVKLTRQFARQVDSAFDDARWNRLRSRTAGEPY
ncbi:MAG: hypothetical protein AB1938_31635 [Myxococcota bacterium]